MILTRQENDGNKDEEGWKTFTTFAKATNSFPATFKTMDGYKLIPTAISISQHLVMCIILQVSIKILCLI